MSVSTLDALLARIVHEVRAREPSAGATRVVAVDGLGGSGKSTLARHVADALGGATVVSTDDFASWDNPVDWWPELLERLLIPLSRGEVARYERSRWGGPTDGEPVVVEPAPFLVLEGVTASREAFAPYLSYAVWVETPTELRLRRGLDRDGDDALPLWQEWMAGEEEYRRRERPDERADIVIRGDEDLWT